MIEEMLPPWVTEKLGITAESLLSMDETKLRDQVRRARTLGRRLQDDGPQNDDELHQWVIDVIGVRIPRIAVCDDHQAPFTLLADCYFERLHVIMPDGERVTVQGALGLANRGGSKTFIVAILHYLNATYKPGCEGLQFGATQEQGNRCYRNVEEWCYEHDHETGRRLDKVKDAILDKPMKSETKFKNGGRIEVVAGSENAVSGPHPQKAGADEVDQMKVTVWNQSRGMAVSKQASGTLPRWMREKYNSIIPPQDIVTSTMNSLNGMMHSLVLENEDAVKKGNLPQFEVVKWCIWETAERQPHCRQAPNKERRKALLAAGRDPDELCMCHRAVKGHWTTADAPSDDLVGKPRTLEGCCKGKAFRADGWKPYVDIVATFLRNTPGTWRLQHECREGQDENAYIQDWSVSLHGIRQYDPDPMIGPIYQGIDWGGTNPYAVLYIQYVKHPVEVLTFDYETRMMQPGDYILFHEIYRADIDTAKLADMCEAYEGSMRQRHGPRWKVAGRFMDQQGKGDRNLFARRGMPGKWPVQTRQKDRLIPIVQNLVIDRRFVVDVEECPAFCEEVEIWQKKPGTDDEYDKNNHAMAAWRYCIGNTEVIHAKDRARRQAGEKPTNRSSTVSTSNNSHPVREREHMGPAAFSGAGVKHPTDQFAMTPMRTR